MTNGLANGFEKSCGALAVVVRLLRDPAFVVFVEDVVDRHRSADADVTFKLLVRSLFQRVFAFVEQLMLCLRLLARHGQRNGLGTAQPHVLGAAILARLVLEYPRSPLAAVANLQIEIPAIGVQAILGGLYDGTQ